MSVIIYNSKRQNVTLETLQRVVNELGYESRIGEWRYLTQAVPQLEIAAETLLALQINDDPNIRDETIEIFGDGAQAFSPEQQATFRECDARIEIVSGRQPMIYDLPGGGVLSHTEEPDLSSPAVQQLLYDVAAKLQGLLLITV